MSASVFTAPGRHLSLAGEITDLTGASLPERVSRPPCLRTRAAVKTHRG